MMANKYKIHNIKLQNLVTKFSLDHQMIMCIIQIDFSQMCQKLFEKKKQVEN